MSFLRRLGRLVFVLFLLTTPAAAAPLPFTLPPNMNYANMIEEKGLKKGFIIATLISTIIGTFTTGINLYDRFGERRRQDKTDSSQNEKIRKLEKRADEAEEKVRRQRIQGPDRRRLDYDDRESVRDAMATSGPLIRGEYDRDVARLGRRFAQGDAITQNQLQALVIDLQASVIRLLQDALITGRKPDPALLFAATGRARNGSIRALQDQYQRMLAAAPGLEYRSRSLSPAADVRAYVHVPEQQQKQIAYAPSHISTTHSMHSRASEPPTPKSQHSSQSMVVEDGKKKDPSSTPSGAFWKDKLKRVQPQIDRQPLFCRYARELQRNPGRPVELYEVEGSREGRVACPDCGSWFCIDLDSSWKMHKPVVVDRVEELDDERPRRGHSDDLDKQSKSLIIENGEIIQDHVLAVDNRFVIKCHRPPLYSPDDLTQVLPPTFACWLCEQYSRPEEPILCCSSMARLVTHLSEEHSLGELVADPDIRQVRRR